MLALSLLWLFVLVIVTIFTSFAVLIEQDAFVVAGHARVFFVLTAGDLVFYVLINVLAESLFV